MASSTVNLKALGLNFSPNNLELPSGSLIEANNVIIRRDDVVESRRGYKIFGEVIPQESGQPQYTKQLMLYRDRILRYYGNKIAYQNGVLNNGEARFTEFAGLFAEAQESLRTKSIQSKNGNFYFTSSEGIKKISAKSADEFTSADGFITQAGGVKALDLEARLNIIPGKSSGFLPANSTVAYRLVWGKIDANNVEVLGTPSERIVVVNPLKSLLQMDLNRLLSTLDNLSSTNSLIADGNYYNSLSVNSDTNAVQLREKLINLAKKIDEDLVFAVGSGGGSLPYQSLPVIGSTVTNGVVSTYFASGTPANYFSIADKIFISNFKSNSIQNNNIEGAQLISNIQDVTLTLGSVNTGTDTITINNHGLSNRDIVRFSTTGTLPSPLNNTTNYYVINSTTNTFQVSTSLDGTVIDLTTAGSGANTVTKKVITFVPRNYTSTLSAGISGAIASTTAPTIAPFDVTITTTGAHGLTSGQRVNISNVNNTVNGIRDVTVLSETSFRITVSAAPAATTGLGLWNLVIDGLNADSKIQSNEYRSITQPSELIANESTSVVDSRGTGAQLISQKTYLNSIISKLKAESTNVIDTTTSSNIGLSNFSLTGSCSVDLEFTVPFEIDSTFYYKIYRSTTITVDESFISPIEEILPPLDYSLALQEYYEPSIKSIDNTITVNDNQTIEFLNKENLYTNEDTSTQEQGKPNDYPPFALDINTFKGYTFYANTKIKQIKDLELDNVSNLKDDLDANLIPSVIISDGTVDNNCKVSFVRGVPQETILTTQSVPSIVSFNILTIANDSALYVDLNTTGLIFLNLKVGDIIKTDAVVPPWLTANTIYYVAAVRFYVTGELAAIALSATLNGPPIVSTSTSGSTYYTLNTNRNYFDLSTPYNKSTYRYHYDLTGSDLFPTDVTFDSKGINITINNPVITSNNHPFKNGDLIRLFSFTPTTLTLTAPISTELFYYVKNVTTNTFELSFSYNGDSIIPTQGYSSLHAIKVNGDYKKLQRIYIPAGSNTQSDVAVKTNASVNYLVDDFSSILDGSTGLRITNKYDGPSSLLLTETLTTALFSSTVVTIGIGESVSSKQAVISSNELLTPSFAVQLATKSFIRILNRNTSSEPSYNTYAYYSDKDQPGLFLLEETFFSDNKFYVTGSSSKTGSAFIPNISPDSATNGIRIGMAIKASAASTSTLRTTNLYNLSVGSAVKFSGTLPSPLNSSTTYYIRNNFPNPPNESLLEISLTPPTGGPLPPPITIAAHSGFTIYAIDDTTPLVFSTPHNFINGQKIIITNSNSVPNIDGVYTVEYVSSTQLKINTPYITTSGTSFLYLNSLNAEYSDNFKKGNRIYHSKFEQPESVSLVNNYYDIGSEEKQILRIFPLRDSLFIFKEDGLFRLSSEFEPFTIALFDSSCILSAPDSVAVSQNLVYGWTTQGISAISESGVSIGSRPIDTEVLMLQSSNYPNFKTATFGVGYESDNSYIVWTVKNPEDTYATQAFRYSTLTGTWTKYTKINNCGVLNPLDDKLYLGLPNVRRIEQERKSFDRTDYSDYEYDYSLGDSNYFGDVIKLPSVSDLKVGDVLTQQQTLTVYDFNSLLNKLDTDPGLTFNDYSSLQAAAGNNLRDKLLQLAQKLDLDPTIGSTDYESTISTKSGSISSISLTNPTILTSNSHGLFTGRIVTVSGAVTIENINGTHSITKIDNNKFSIPIDVDVNNSTVVTWVTDDNNFDDLLACYNKIIEKLNSDSGTAFSNYLSVNNESLLESVIINVNYNLKKITLNKTLDYVQGPIKIYSSIDCSIIYSPNTFGDPLSFKHIREATVMFANKAFTAASLGFATDLLPAYTEVEFNGDGSGLFGNNNFGSNFFGGGSSAAPFRTIVPKNAQRCRFLSISFSHNVAREQFALYGITLTGKTVSTRAYR
jgi:hypothetical protein